MSQTILLICQQMGELGIFENIHVVEGAANPIIRGHRLEQFGTVNFLSMYKTLLEEVFRLSSATIPPAVTWQT